MPTPRHKPTDVTRRQVKAMAGYGLTQDQIASLLGVERQTIVKYYRQELDLGVIEANATVAQSLYRTATGPSSRDQVTAAIFWAKTRMGWKEPRQEVDINARIDGNGDASWETLVAALDGAASTKARRADRAGAMDLASKAAAGNA